MNYGFPPCAPACKHPLCLLLCCAWAAPPPPPPPHIAIASCTSSILPIATMLCGRFPLPDLPPTTCPPLPTPCSYFLGWGHEAVAGGGRESLWHLSAVAALAIGEATAKQKPGGSNLMPPLAASWTDLYLGSGCGRDLLKNSM